MGVASFIKQLHTNILATDDPGLAAEMAYHAMLSLLPALIFTVSIFELVGSRLDVMDQVVPMLAQVVPTDLMPLIRDTFHQIVTANSGGFALAGFFGALWTASNGAAVIFKGLGRSYQLDNSRHTSSFVKERAFAIVMIVLITLGLLIGLNLLLFGDVLIDWLAGQYTLGTPVTTGLNVLRIALVLLGMVVITAMIYGITLFALKQRLSWRESLPGAITFVALWLIMSWGFRLYVTNMGNYNQVYGTLGVIIVLLVWLYLSSFTFLVGGEVNALIYHRRHHHRLPGSPKESKQQGQPATSNPTGG